MPPTERYTDVLLLTALEEESFVLYECLFKQKNPTVVSAFNRQFYQIEFENKTGTSLKLTLGNLNGMGNAWAMDQSLRLIDLFCPRYVLMGGVAGGNRHLMERGDVGFSTAIRYSSYGKFFSESLWKRIQPKIRPIKADLAKKRLAKQTGVLYERIRERLRNEKEQKHTVRLADPDIEVDEIFCSTAGELANNPKIWQDLAQRWFDECLDSFDRKYGTGSTTPDDPLPKQLGFGRRPIAREAVYASGEAVIASDEFQEQIQKLVPPMQSRSKVDNRIAMFDMESFGLSKACLLRGVRFGVAKGVSDLAGTDKASKSSSSSGKTDSRNAFRLAAIASSSAFLTTLIKNFGFYTQLRSANPPHVGWSRSACGWTVSEIPDTVRECVHMRSKHDELDIFERDRPCTKFREARGKKQAAVSRIYEEVSPDDYSEYIAKAVRDEQSKVLLVFPYSMRDLLAFFANSRLKSLRTRAVKLEELLNSDKARKDELLSAALDLGDTARGLFPHFQATDEVCRSLIADGHSYFSVAQRICRVICIREEEQSNILQSPAYVLFPALCGLAVPTLLADEDLAVRFFDDEATFITRQRTRSSDDDDCPTSTMCLKYADRSRLLVVLGRCDDLPDAEATRQNRRIFGLAAELRANLAENRTAPLKIWPILELVNKYKAAKSRLLERTEWREEKSASYLNELRELEKK